MLGSATRAQREELTLLPVPAKSAHTLGGQAPSARQLTP